MYLLLRSKAWLAVIVGAIAAIMAIQEREWGVLLVVLLGVPPLTYWFFKDAEKARDDERPGESK